MHLSYLLCLLTAAVVAGRRSRRGDAPLTPDLDPWNKPPSGWEETAPGSILRSRTVQPGFLTAIPVPVKAWQLLYRSTDAIGRPMTTVTTILVPPKASYEKLFAVGTPEDSTSPECAPSYGLQLGAQLAQTALTTDVQEAILAPVLAKGIILTIPDIEGPDSAFGAGRLAGHALLDGIRATVAFGSTIGLNSDAKVAVWGYSGGAIAAGWAAALKDTYAPELRIVGVSQGGTPSDYASVVVKLTGGNSSYFVLSFLIGLTRAYPAFKESFDSITTPKMKALVKANENAVLCNLNPKALFVDFLASNEYLTLGLASLKLPVWADTFQDNKLGANETLTPTMPLQVIHSKGDDLIPYEQAAELVAAYCATGTATVEFHTNNNPLVNHIVEAVYSVPGAFAWLNDRLDGVPAAKGCTYTS